MKNILVLGAKGMLGGQLMQVLDNPVGWDRQDCDVTDKQKLELKIKGLKPSAIINCVAFNDVDAAESNNEIAFKLNAEAVENIAKIASKLDIPVVHFSTNYVFDGVDGEYDENSTPCPLNVYGMSKAEGERLLQKNAKKFYLVRTAVIFGPKGESEMSKKSFIDIMLTLSQTTSEIKAVTNEINSVTYAKDLAEGVKKLLEENYPYGIYHFANQGSVSWYDLAHELFQIKKIMVSVTGVPSSEFPRKAIRPKIAVLLNTKFPPFRPWQEALKEYLTDKS